MSRHPETKFVTLGAELASQSSLRTVSSSPSAGSDFSPNAPSLLGQCPTSPNVVGSHPQGCLAAIRCPRGRCRDSAARSCSEQSGGDYGDAVWATIRVGTGRDDCGVEEVLAQLLS